MPIETLACAAFAFSKSSKANLTEKNQTGIGVPEKRECGRRIAARPE
jgi:hypothetical protein